MADMPEPTSRMMIAIDPHKASWTAAVVDTSLRPVATLRVSVSREGYRSLRRFARRWPHAEWAIEGATGLGAPLTARLRDDGTTVTDVPAKLASRVRLLSAGHGRKNDDADALSVGIAALSGAQLNTAQLDGELIALRALVEHRDDLVKVRTQTINRLHIVLTTLTPGGARRVLTAAAAAELLKTIRPRDTAGRTLRELAVDLTAEVRHLDRRIVKATGEIDSAVTASGSRLTALRGLGTLTAGKILGRVGSVHRFRSAAAFASYTGTAPIEVSSGDVVRHRLSRAGDRQLNYCLHIMAIAQIARDTPGHSYYERKRAAGKSHQEAMRCLKRRLSDVVYAQLVKDAAERLGAGPGGH